MRHRLVAAQSSQSTVHDKKEMRERLASQSRASVSTSSTRMSLALRPALRPHIDRSPGQRARQALRLRLRRSEFSQNSMLISTQPRPRPSLPHIVPIRFASDSDGELSFTWHDRSKEGRGAASRVEVAWRGVVCCVLQPCRLLKVESSGAARRHEDAEVSCEAETTSERREEPSSAFAVAGRAE
ncbi:hypothetical protein BDZ90DRAFT_167992 [Jaminaea rosea]|uniref:Uncharacterized protein n=1 Tax=Jaminaea rosea TaxID=1569628 RepID=A0A316UUN6_9BASI|nr:hypothetical protein BDZ90DRAFT_167992 [Jaminaea rosea]PWN27623.1 hypothetical protein BDZ90DRAFT_167992 [Jaminaea rosea]